MSTPGVENRAIGGRLSLTSAHRRTLIAAVVGLAVTVGVMLVPPLRFAYRNPDGRLALETLAAFVAALVALQFYGRFRRSGSLQSLLVVYAMGLLGFAALALVVLPVVSGAPVGSSATTWGALVVRLLAAFLLLAAALVPRRLVEADHLLRDTLMALALLGSVVLLVQVLSMQLPPAVATDAPPEQSAVPSLDAHPLVLAVQVTNFLCFAFASIAFTRQAARTRDRLAGWVGAALALGACARLNYLLYPSLYSEWLYSGDVLRLGFYLLLLVAAWKETREYWGAQARAAVFDERRRLARDLHDGTIQEIGYIRTQLDEVGGPVAERIRSAVDRALDETRAALAALTVGGDEPLAEALRRSVEQVADRHDVTVRWLVDPSAEVRDVHRNDLVRIAREAVGNAARHSRAEVVHVTLRPGALEVVDEGRGFDLAAPVRPGSFGLTSMRDRAVGMDGVLEVLSTPGRGTKVVVRWPTNL